MEAFMLLNFFFQSGYRLPKIHKHKIMQEKKIQCILLQSESGGQGDIPIPGEKMGTLTHYKWDLAGGNCSASAIHCTSVFKELS